MVKTDQIEMLLSWVVYLTLIPLPKECLGKILSSPFLASVAFNLSSPIYKDSINKTKLSVFN